MWAVTVNVEEAKRQRKPLAMFNLNVNKGKPILNKELQSYLKALKTNFYKNVLEKIPDTP